MPLILSLETSSTGCSVAVHEDGRLVDQKEFLEPHAHGARLAPMIAAVMDNAGRRMSDLSAVAVASGPGSYTGLRIGASTAKGLCFALSIPLLSVDSLTAMTLRASRSLSDVDLFCPMLDARRMEVYCAVLNPDLSFVEPIQAKIIEEDSFADLLASSRIGFFGNGAAKCSAAIVHANAVFGGDIRPSAGEVGELAWKKFQQSSFEDLVEFEPMYLKEFLIKKPTKSDAVLNK